jgi:PBP1b-binding outer membrane lipoprotein LpoB
MVRMVASLKKRWVMVLVLMVFVSGCAMCARDPLFERDRNPTDPLTAMDRCTQKVLW